MTTDSQQNKNTGNDEISLKEIILKIREWWRYLLSKWVVIGAFGLLGGALGFWYATIEKPVYTASTTFVLEDEKGGGGISSLAGLASMAGVDLSSGGGNIFQSDNLPQLYKSRLMVEKTLLSPSESEPSKLLIDSYIEFNNLKKSWNKNKDLSELRFTVDSIPNLQKADGVNLKRLRDSILSTIVADINKNYLLIGKPDKKLSLIKVDVKAPNELFAKEFNDKIVENVNEFYLQTKTKKSLNNIRILQQKTDSVRRMMNRSIYSAVTIGDATPNLNPTKQIQRTAPIQSAQFNSETNKAVLGELVKNLELTKMTLLKETPLIQVVDKPVYPLSVIKFSKLRGIIIGGFFLGFLTIIVFIVRKILQDILD